MDGLHDGLEGDALTLDDAPAIERPPGIGTDERRMQVRAYNYWVSLLGNRTYPSIEDVNPASIDDFGPHSVLLDFSAGPTDPGIPFIGSALRRECGLYHEIRTLADVPPRSLLSRLTDHYMQIIANCAPIGFEAEFINQRGRNTMYRGILMPLSSDGQTIDFLYGVINWKEVADPVVTAELARELGHVPAAPTAATPVWADGPSAAPPVLDILHEELGPGPLFASQTDAGLADRLWTARETAEAVKKADGRSRAALYRALGQAYDFALASEAEPADYAELLADAGLKTQARAPMTPVLKLVFGADYDKTRLTEFAAALCLARREALPAGGLHDLLNQHPGGLKALVAAERAARRPSTPATDKAEEARARLRAAPALAALEFDIGEAEFGLLVARRAADGRVEIVAAVDDPRAVDRAMERAARLRS